MLSMKTEELLRYERMYRAMREVLHADVLAFGFRPQNRLEDAGSETTWRCLKEAPKPFKGHSKPSGIL